MYRKEIGTQALFPIQMSAFLLHQAGENKIKNLPEEKKSAQLNFERRKNSQEALYFFHLEGLLDCSSILP